MPKQTRIALGLLTMYLAWGTTYIGIAFAIETMPDLLAMGLRFIAAATLQFAVVAATSGPSQFRVTLRKLLTSLGLGTMMLGAGLGTVSTAEHVVPVGVAALIVATMPLWTTLLRLVTGERPRSAAVLGVVTGFIGVAVILQPGHTVPRVGGGHHNVTLWMLIMLLGNVSWSLGSFLTPKVDIPRRPLVLTTYEMLAAGAVLSGVGLAQGQSVSDMVHASVRSWLGWSYLVVIGSVVGYTTYNWLLANAPITLVSTYSYVNPIVAIALGTAIFGEPVTDNIALGGVLVVVSVALVVFAERSGPVPASRAAG